jgi:alpha-L-rhamnosidase
MRKEAGNSFLYRPKNKQFGDWVAYAPANRDYPGATTDKNLISTAYFYHSVDILSQVSTILNKVDDAANYLSLKGKIKNSFNKEFVTPNGRLLSNTQTSYVLALAFGLLPTEIEKIAASYLAEDVNLFGHITTGFLGTADICHILSKYGFLEEAYHLLYRKEYPSWLYPVAKGATTIWERWDGIKPDGTFQDPIMNSFNHYAYGAVGDWLYKVVAGINPNNQNPGYKQITIKPHPGSTMNNVKASYKSLYGTIFSDWEIKDQTIYLKVAIPPNTSADVYIPSTGDDLYINGELKDFQEIITQSGLKYHFLKVKIGSGDYVFKSDYAL